MWSFSHITVCDIKTGEGDTSSLRNVWSIHLFPNLCSQKTVSNCPLQWEMSFHVRSNTKLFLIFWCTPLSQTGSKTTPWWCVVISYCVDDRTLWLLHQFHPPWFSYPSNIWRKVQILKLIKMLLLSNFMLLILFHVQIFSSASCSPATSIPEPKFLPYDMRPSVNSYNTGDEIKKLLHNL
jgi:hypothetical protein